MIKRWTYLLTSALLGALLLLGGCGDSETFTPPPVPDNPFEGATVGTDTTLEVVTWNLQNFARAGATTVDLVIEAVSALDVDIVALQEIESLTRFTQLTEGLSGWAGQRATSAGYSINLAYLYKVDGNLQVDAIYEILTSESRAFPRRPLVLEGRYGSKSFVIINNHYKCCGNGSIDEDENWDEEVRRRDANLLLEQFVDANFPNRPVMIVGDLNDDIADQEPQNVFMNFLEKPQRWRFVDMFIAEDRSLLWSWPKGSHLDHILVTDQFFDQSEEPEAMVAVLPLHEHLKGGLTTYFDDISDHLPVVLRLTP